MRTALHLYFITRFYFLTSDEEEITMSFYLHQNDSILNLKESSFVWQGKINSLQNLKILTILSHSLKSQPYFESASNVQLDLRQSGCITSSRTKFIFVVKVSLSFFPRQWSAVRSYKACLSINDHIFSSIWSCVLYHCPLYYPGNLFFDF